MTVDGNSTTTTNLLTSNQISLNTVHSPAVMCIFKQNGTITRNINISAVDVESLAQLQADGVTFNGYGLVQDNPAQENSDGTGAYRITLASHYYIANSDIDVVAKNASNYVETTRSATLTSDQAAYLQDQTLTSGYYIIPDQGAPTTFNQIMVYFLAPKYNLEYDNANNEWTTFPVAANLTPGYDNDFTRFKVTVYGDLV
jgi:hypothetical protein